jgi:ribulose-5-phosphate 4-epimerase/fuculose-1-phosphate aldolase
MREFLSASHRVAREGLVRCSSGNLSWRLDACRMLVTGTRTWLGTLRAGQVALCRLEDGAVLNGVRPSAETAFHAGILSRRKDVNVVLHFQTPFATTVGCLRRPPADFFVIPEMPYYIGPVAYVPYRTPGSADLARLTIAAMRRHDMAVLRNHGAVTVGTTFDDAIQKATFFELACEVVVRAGARLRRMPKGGARELLRLRSEGRPRAV